MRLMTMHKIDFFIKNLPEPTLLVDAKGIIVAINTKATHLLQQKKEQLLGNSLAQCSSLKPNQMVKIIRMGQRSRQLIALKIPFVDSNGHALSLNASGFLFFVSEKHDNKYLMIRLKLQDIAIQKFIQLNTKLKKQHKHMRLLQKSKEELEVVSKTLNHYIDIVDRYVISTSTDTEGIITRVSEAFCDISKYSREELIGKPHAMLKHPDIPDDVFELLLGSETKRHWHGELKNLAKDGSSYYLYADIEPDYDENGTFLGYTAIKQNITDKKYIEKLSQRDTLTGLANRLKIDSVVAYQIEQSIHCGGFFSIIMVDIDFFKNVNDNYGHLVGDSVLMELSDILISRGRATDTVGRWGGEEFLIIAPQTTFDGALALAEDLRKSIEKYQFSKILHLTCSFGVANYKPKESYQRLLKRADNGLYRAKALGRNQVQSV